MKCFYATKILLNINFALINIFYVSCVNYLHTKGADISGDLDIPHDPLCNPFRWGVLLRAVLVICLQTWSFSRELRVLIGVFVSSMIEW